MDGPTYKVANGMGCLMQNIFKATIHKISKPAFVANSLLICLHTGIMIDYNSSWLPSNLEVTQPTHGRIEIRTVSADAGSSGPTLEEVSSWAAQCTSRVH